MIYKKSSVNFFLSHVFETALVENATSAICNPWRGTVVNHFSDGFEPLPKATRENRGMVSETENCRKLSDMY